MYQLYLNKAGKNPQSNYWLFLVHQDLGCAEMLSELQAPSGLMLRPS